MLRTGDFFTALKFDTPQGQQVVKELLESLESKTAAEILDGPALPTSIKDVYPTMHHYSSEAILPPIRRQPDGSLLLPVNPSGTSTYWTPALIDDASDPRLILQAPGASKRYRVETEVLAGDNAFHLARAYDIEYQTSRNWIETLIKDNPTPGFELGPPQFTTQSGRSVRVYDRVDNRYLNPNEFQE